MSAERAAEHLRTHGANDPAQVAEHVLAMHETEHKTRIVHENLRDIISDEQRKLSEVRRNL